MDFAELRDFIVGIIDKIKAWFLNYFQDSVDTEVNATEDITGDGVVDNAE